MRLFFGIFQLKVVIVIVFFVLALIAVVGQNAIVAKDAIRQMRNGDQQTTQAMRDSIKKIRDYQPK